MKKDIRAEYQGDFWSSQIIICLKKNTEKTLECDCKMTERVKTREFQ